jgi:hypothetical protein
MLAANNFPLKKGRGNHMVRRWPRLFVLFPIFHRRPLATPAPETAEDNLGCLCTYNCHDTPAMRVWAQSSGEWRIPTPDPLGFNYRRTPKRMDEEL